MYSPEVLDHFEHPRNAGTMDDADARVGVENPACGDVLELTVKVSGGEIADVRFRAKGCVPAMACASALTELIKGKSLIHASRVTRQEVATAVGGLPAASGHAAVLALDALRAVLRSLPQDDESA